MIQRGPVSSIEPAFTASSSSIDELGDDYAVEPPTLATVMLAKRQAVTDAIAVVDLAMTTTG